MSASLALEDAAQLVDLRRAAIVHSLHIAAGLLTADEYGEAA